MAESFVSLFMAPFGFTTPRNRDEKSKTNGKVMDTSGT